jgi:hypothetical protein
MLLQTWLSVWRDFYICANGSDMPLTFLNFRCFSQRTAEKLTEPVIYQELIILETALGQLDTNLNSRLLVETLLLDWPVIS